MDYSEPIAPCWAMVITGFQLNPDDDERVNMSGAYIFVSYARNSDVSVEYKDWLVRELKAQNFDVWIDHVELLPGDEWSDEIQNAIDTCEVLIVIWSKEASESKWVKREIGRADEKSKPIIPLLFDHTDLGIRLQHLQYADFRTAWVKGFQSLIGQLNNYFNSSVETISNGQNKPWERTRRPYIRSQFLAANSYLNSSSSEFAQSDRTESLRPSSRDDIASTWLSLVTIPIPDEIPYEILDRVRALYTSRNSQSFIIGTPSTEEPWRWINLTSFTRSYDQDTEYLIYCPVPERDDVDKPEFLTSGYLRFTEAGAIEYAIVNGIMHELRQEQIRIFNFVYILGTAWKFLPLSLQMYSEWGYNGRIQFLVNLKSTKDAYLGNFAKPLHGQKGWLDPISTHYRNFSNAKSMHKNLQFIYNISVSDFSNNLILTESLITDFSKRLQQSFNYPAADRHYVPNTTKFPWAQYYTVIF